jgi:hypothetical protein
LPVRNRRPHQAGKCCPAEPRAKLRKIKELDWPPGGTEIANLLRGLFQATGEAGKEVR